MCISVCIYMYVSVYVCMHACMYAYEYVACVIVLNAWGHLQRDVVTTPYVQRGFDPLCFN